jgi:hypothetical protein
MGLHCSTIDKTPKYDLAWAMKRYRHSWGEVDWKRLLSSGQQFADDDIHQHRSVIDWKVWAQHYTGITKEMVIKYRSRIDMNELSYNPNLNEDTIRKFIRDLRLVSIVEHSKISYELAHMILLDDTLCSHARSYLLLRHQFPESALETLMSCQHVKVYYIGKICQYQALSESFMLKNKNRLDWNTISQYQKPTLAFIEQNPSLIKWDRLSYNKQLTLSVVEHYRDRLLDTEEVGNILNTKPRVEKTIDIKLMQKKKK